MKQIINFSTLMFAIVTVLLWESVNAQVTFTQSSSEIFSYGDLNATLTTSGNVQLKQQGTDMGTWTGTYNFVKTISGHQTARWNNYVYLSGGFDGTSYSNGVYRATMNATGNTGWTVYDTLPEPLRDHGMVAGLNHLYVI